MIVEEEILKKRLSMKNLLTQGEANAMHPTFAKELGLPIRLTDIGAQKIDGITGNPWDAFPHFEQCGH